MSNELIQRYLQINAELDAICKKTDEQKEVDVLQETMAVLKAERDNLQNTLYFMALSHLRDEAWRALSYGVGA